MHRGKSAVLWLVAISSAVVNVSADEPARAPLANSFGRFWGIGYSAGYNARSESRFGWHRYVPEHNAVAPLDPAQATMFRTNMNACQPTSIVENRAAIEPTASITGLAPPASQPSQRTSSNPTSSWMRQLLKPDASPPVESLKIQPANSFQRDDLPSDNSPSGNSPSDNSPGDNSPSDQRGVLLPFTKRYASPQLTVAPRLP